MIWALRRSLGNLSSHLSAQAQVLGYLGLDCDVCDIWCWSTGCLFGNGTSSCLTYDVITS